MAGVVRRGFSTSGQPTSVRAEFAEVHSSLPKVLHEESYQLPPPVDRPIAGLPVVTRVLSVVLVAW